MILRERFSFPPSAGNHRRVGGIQLVQDEAALLGTHTAEVVPARKSNQKGGRRTRKALPRGGAETRSAAADTPYGKTEWNRHRGGVRGVRGANRQAEGNVPIKMSNYVMAVISHVPVAREHGGRQQPGRERGAPIAARRKISGQTGSMKGMRRLGIVHMLAYPDQEERQRLSGVGSRPGFQMMNRTEPKRVPPITCKHY